MKVQEQDFGRFRKVCNHEAGHYVIARENNFKTDGISVQFYHPIDHNGQSGIQPWTPLIKTIPDIEEYIERRVQVLYAGAIAEAIGDDKKYNSDYALNEWRSGGSRNDYAKIRELIQVLRNIRYSETRNENDAQDQLDKIDAELIEKTGNLVLERINLIHGIGDTIFQKIEEYNVKYELTEEEINEIKTVRSLYGNS